MKPTVISTKKDKLVSIKTYEPDLKTFNWTAHFEYLDGCSDCEGWLDAHWILMEVFEMPKKLAFKVANLWNDNKNKGVR